MKSLVIILIASFLSISAISCTEKYESQIVFNTNKNNIIVGLSGNRGTAVIDWGDKQKTKSKELWSLPIDFNHSYLKKNIHTVTIFKAITDLLNPIFESTS